VFLTCIKTNNSSQLFYIKVEIIWKLFIKSSIIDKYSASNHSIIDVLFFEMNNFFSFALLLINLNSPLHPFDHLLHNLMNFLFMPNIMPHVIIEKNLFILDRRLRLFKK
jgi:hypothetical protein